MTFVVRLDPALYPDPMRFAPLLRRAVANISRDQAVFQMLPFEKIISNRLAPRRLSMIVLIAFAGLSLVLAAMGIYGVLAFSVEQRTHEIGVRMALGAQQGDVLRIIVREAVLLAAGGLVVGVAAALALGRLATSLLYGVTATDPLVLTGTAVLLALVAAAAAWFPARRATRVDPLEALRYE
jgi:putative ABC transport system permease protein